MSLGEITAQLKEETDVGRRRGRQIDKKTSKKRIKKINKYKKRTEIGTLPRISVPCFDAETAPNLKWNELKVQS